MSIGKLKTSKVVVWAAAATITVLIISGIFWPYIMSAWNSVFGPGPTEEKRYIYSGNLQINLVTYNIYNDAVKDPDNNVVVRIFHADGSTIFGVATNLDGTDSISGQVFPSDAGILYLSIDHESGTTEYFIDAKTASVNDYLTALPPRDVDGDGVLEHYWKLDVSSLSPLQAGETSKTITLNIYCMPCDVTGLDWVPTINPSAAGLSGTSYIDLTAEGYMTGVDEGSGFKVVRVELTLPNSGNVSYVEDGKVKNVWVQIGSDRWTVLSWQPAQSRFLVWEATDITQEVYGKEYYYAKNAGTTWLTYKVHIQGANFASGAKWMPTLKITVINPAGTISTVSETLSFTDT